MKLSKYLTKYIEDNVYKITIFNNCVNVNNYQDIKDFSDTKIVINHSNGTTIITGTNLTITKLLDKELLITGNIYSLNL